MVPTRAKAMILLLVLMLPAASFAQNPYSDAAFRTFISVSVDNTTVTAKLTYLNITYFRQINESKIAEVAKKVNASRDPSDLYQPGNYSIDSFTAEVLPAKNISMTFTFEGNPVLDASGNEICNLTKTDENGMASCDIRHYKDPVNGATRKLEDYKSCGYATVKSEEKGDLPSASQTTTVCPENVYALSAFAGAIQSEVGSNLPFCFPAMLIAGLLIAAMYYSGRDPLSLFDITVPKLPKTPSFKVKMQTSPQMLRQVQRRYMMMKKQARRDSVREVARLARRSGMSVAEAKKDMNRLYDETEALVKKNQLSEDAILAIRTSWAGLMERYKPAPGDKEMARRFERTLAFSSGLHQAYLQSHQAWMAMGEARGKTSKGGLWSRNVSKPLIDNLAKASVSFEESKVGKVLGRIPLVKKVVAAPSKALDVTSQLRGSRTALKAIRGEMFGQMATMLGRTMLGKPVYRAFKGAHVKGDGKQTAFGKAYTFITGRDWRKFEEKHDLSKKRLVEYYNVIASMRQQAIDAHNWTFDSIAAKLIYALPIRANAMQQEEVKRIMAAMGVDPKDLARLANATALDALFAKLRENMKGNMKGEELVKELAKAMAMSSGSDLDEHKQEKKNFERQLEKIEGIIAKLKGSDRDNARELLAQLREYASVENELTRILNNKYTDQSSLLGALVNLVDKRSPGDIRHIKDAVKMFDANETILRENALVYLNSKNYYQIVEKRHLESDIAAGMSEKKLEEKYGKNVVALTSDRELFRQMLDIRTAGTGEKLKQALNGFMHAMGLASLTPDERRMLSQVASDFGGKRELTPAQKAKISAMMDAMDSLRLKVDGRVFGKFNDAEARMKTWVLNGGSATLLNNYRAIADIFNDRLKALAMERIKTGETLELHEIVREGSAFGKNPLELVIEKALADVIVARAKAGGKTQDEARDLANEMLVFMRGKGGKLKDMDMLEQFFKKSAAGEAHTQDFVNFLRRVSPDLTSETLFKSAMVQVNDFAREWSARNYAAIEMMHGGNTGRYMASFANASSDILAFGKVKSNMAYLGGEKEFYQQEMGYSDYRKFGLSSAVFTARGWEKLFGFIVSKDWGGTSRGEQVLHLMDSTENDYRAVLGRYKALYNNLINKESVFYNEKFKERMDEIRAKDKNDVASFDLHAYEELLKRGYTWQDKKNGLELLMSVDRKSSPMILSGDFLKGQNEIVKKGEIRDYAGLLAGTMGSYYSTREVGFVVLVKKDGKWVYGDPFLDKDVRKASEDADKKVTMRREKMEKMVEDGTIKVISTKDFVTYAKDKNYSHFFGNLNAMDRARESLRSAFYKPGMLWGEFVYGAYSERTESMMRWYAAQWQVRQTLDRLKHSINDEGAGMVAGSDRFKYDEKSMDRIYSNASLPKVDASEETRASLEKEMGKLNSGEGSFADGAKAWYHNWHGRVASGIIGEIGNAESEHFNSKLELRALERLHEKGGIKDAEYSRLKGEISARNSEIKSDYKLAKDEYMGLNRDMIGWVGSKGAFTYAPQRTIWNFGIVSKMLDSHHVQGTQDAFYQISESSVMRDPRVAIGAHAPGWDYSYYVGYHTGQNVYERTRYWATNSLWEQQMRFHTDLVFTVHKWWNDRMSFFSRYTSGYPAPVKSDMMNAPTYEPRKTSDYFKALAVIMPFQSRTYSDYFRSRWQDSISFSGVGHMLAAYQSMGNVSRYGTPEEGQEKRSWLRRQIDKFGMESEHYTGAGGTPFRIASQQRYIDQVMKFDEYVDSDKGRQVTVEVDGVKMSLAAARDEMKQASAVADMEREEKYAQGISDAIGAVANLKDRRGRYIRDVFSGSDIQEDGSRNRFLDMYTMFHSNVFTPTIPGMLQFSPIGKGEWYTFPQVAREVDKAGDKTRLGAMKNYWQAGYDADEGRITFADRFTVKQDAVSEAYRNDVPVLMHLMKMQNKEIGYSVLNSPQMAYLNPLWFGLGRKIYKTAISHTPGMEGFTSTFHEPEWNLPGGSMVKHYIARRRGEIPLDTLDGDYRHAIYGDASRAIMDEAEKTNSFFRWWRDLVYGIKFYAAPGIQDVSKETKKEQLKTRYIR